MNNIKVFGLALAFTGMASAFIYESSDEIIEWATNVMTNPVAGINENSSTEPAQTTQIDCSERMPRFDTNEVCAPSKTEIMLGKYEAPTRQP